MARGPSSLKRILSSHSVCIPCTDERISGARMPRNLDLSDGKRMLLRERGSIFRLMVGRVFVLDVSTLLPSRIRVGRMKD
jgi:hypothetical protein